MLVVVKSAKPVGQLIDRLNRHRLFVNESAKQSPFERVAKKYNVDFAIKKDKTTVPPKYVVLFKGRDADAIAQAFKEFVYGNEKKKGRVSLREKLKHFKDAVSQDKNRERSREKNKDRGQSL